MRLRNLFFIGLAATALFVGCKEDETQQTPSITLSETSVEFGEEADEMTITVTATRDWVATLPSDAEDWLTVTPASGSADETYTVTIAVDANTGENRNATVEFNASLASETLTVTQTGPQGGNPYQEFLDAAEGAELTVEGTVVAINNSGVVINDGPGNLMTFSAAASYNPPTNVNIGDRLSISGTKAIHNGFPQLAADYENFTVVSEGSESDVVYPTPVVVNAETFSSLDRTSCIYIQFEGVLSISGHYYNVEIDGVGEKGSLQSPLESLGVDGYEGQMAVYTGYQSAGGNGFLNMIVVSVEPSDTPYLNVTPTSATIPAAGGNAEITIAGNVAWTATCDNSAFTLSKTSGTGSEVITVSANENTSADAINGNVTISTAESVETASYTVKITQLAATVAGTPDLFFSEYVEGSSNNKYLEIYNPTDQTVDLSQYAIDLNTNGGSNWSNDGSGFKNYTELSGTLAPGAVIVYKNAQAAIYEGEATDCNAVNFNGNDPVGLFKNGELIDVIGTFNGGSADFAKDVTLRRKSSVTAPSTVYNPDEWEELDKDDVSGLGSHTVE